MSLVYMAALAYSTITGLSFIFGKTALSVASPLDVLAYRFTVSALAVALLWALRVIRFRITARQLLRIIPLAVFYPLLFFLLQTYGLARAGALEAGILSASMPIFTLILARIFLKERTGPVQILCILASVAGVIFITVVRSGSEGSRSMAGSLLILLCTLSFSLYSIMARRLTRTLSSSDLAPPMVLISFVTFTLIAVISHLVAGDLADVFKPLKDGRFLISIGYLGLLSTLGTAWLTAFVLSRLEATRVSVFSNLGTIVTVVASVLILDESLSLHHIVAMLLIVGGVIGTNRAAAVQAPEVATGESGM